MVHFIVSYFINNDLLLDTIRCCTEIVDDSDIRYREHITAIEVAHFGMTGHGSATPMIAKRAIPMLMLNCSPFLSDGYNKKKPSNEDPDCK